MMRDADRKISSIDEIRKIEINILRYVHWICEKHNLKYILAGGTLLGAIRHKGYIPWDDDIDILMPRMDYEKLIRIINHSTSGRFKFLTYRNERNYLLPFGKVVDTRTYLEFFNELPCENMGVFIDVFPMDGFVENDMKYFSDKKCALENLRCNSKLGIIGKMFAKYTCYLVDKKAGKYEYDNAGQVACKVIGMGKREIIDRELVDNRMLVEFEGRLFYAPVGYDTYLTNFFKDYMKLPPKHQQRRGHLFTAWYRGKGSEQ